jgi:hypothetical protein
MKISTYVTIVTAGLLMSADSSLAQNVERVEVAALQAPRTVILTLRDAAGAAAAFEKLRVTIDGNATGNLTLNANGEVSFPVRIQADNRIDLTADRATSIESATVVLPESAKEIVWILDENEGNQKDEFGEVIMDIDNGVADVSISDRAVGSTKSNKMIKAQKDHKIVWRAQDNGATICQISVNLPARSSRCLKCSKASGQVNACQ